MMYHFEDKNSEKNFENVLHERFPRHKVEENGSLRYFGFADRAEPGVVDKLNTVLSRVEKSSKDYVALYHAKHANPNSITRTMLVGHDNVLENKVEKLSNDAHQNSLSELLDFDYQKAAQPGNGQA